MNVLEGIRVVDLSTAYSAPIATMQLADFGADVIKVENTGKGDGSRTWNPMVDGEGIGILYSNRNKRSVALNLKSEEGKKALFDLVKTADVVVENFRPGVCKKLGIDYEAMKALRRADDGIALGYLFKEPVQGRINEAKAIDCRQLCVYGPCLNEKNAEELKAMGFSIRAWGIADEAAMRHAAALADGGMTVNFPDKLTTYRKELGI